MCHSRGADHVGVQHTGTDDHAFHLGQAELLGGSIAQQDGHEVEEAVAQRIQDVVGRACIAQDAKGHEHGQKALQDAAGAQHAQAGREHTGDDADERVQRVHLFLRGVLLGGGRTVLVDRTARGDVAHGAHSVVDVCHLVADDHHVLAAGTQDLDDAVGLLKDLGVCLALVLQFEAQAGDAVGERSNVLLAAHILDDNTRKTIIFTSHKPILLFTCFVCLFGQLKAQPPIAQTDGGRKRQSRQRRRVRKAFVLECHGNAAAPPGGGGHVRLTAHKGEQLVQQCLPGFRFLQRPHFLSLSGHTKVSFIKMQ